MYVLISNGKYIRITLFTVNMKFGVFLRKERELRGMTLEEISHQTKVHTRFLEAIELDDFSLLPAKAFAKGFLRSYARMVGLDEELVITNFEYCHRTLQTKEESDHVRKHAESQPRHRLVFLTLMLIIVVLTAIIILYYQGYLTFNWL
ncbi:hypothetical protein U27_06423 [Candidatus Vecturithrix granuli]|uniref:Helix-turn-helix domain-containing protein n=1 Tax=Vecturithrix granuli TaxID=1499967 RepID=A0A081C4D3_VECG1|nr:hypothetical protein U27_06423 [Candidatus Vecturithrix granuli]